MMMMDLPGQGCCSDRAKAETDNPWLAAAETTELGCGG
jgi:hypothetical protein